MSAFPYYEEGKELPSHEINESPERTTAGLSSAAQMVDFTSAETYAIGNTSSLSPVIGTLIRGAPGLEPEQTGRKTEFKAALRESLRKNRAIIEELAKY